MSESRRCGEETIAWLTEWLTTPLTLHCPGSSHALLAPTRLILSETAVLADRSCEDVTRDLDRSLSAAMLDGVTSIRPPHRGRCLQPTAGVTAGVSVKLSVFRSDGVRESSDRVGLITLDFPGDYFKIIGKNSGFRNESFLWSHSTPPPLTAGHSPRFAGGVEWP